jgi:mono/diheme cytochrome c family protein
MRFRLALGFVLAGVVAVAVFGFGAGPAATPAAAEEKAAATPSFKDDVKPILDGACTSCHNPKKMKGRIDLSSYAGVGKTLKVGSPDQSRLVKSLHGKGARQMPPKSKLDDKDIDTIKEWIKAGAKND